MDWGTEAVSSVILLFVEIYELYYGANGSESRMHRDEKGLVFTVVLVENVAERLTAVSMSNRRASERVRLRAIHSDLKGSVRQQINKFSSHRKTFCCPWLASLVLFACPSNLSSLLFSIYRNPR